MIKTSSKQMIKAVSILVFVFVLGSTIAIVKSEARLALSPVLQITSTPDPGDNWGNEKISAHRLWQSGYTGDDVVVAVIDVKDTGLAPPVCVILIPGIDNSPIGR